MAVHELRPGEQCEIAAAPVRVSLIGVPAGASRVRLRVLDGGTPAKVHWASPTEAVLMPTQQTVTIVAEPDEAGTLIEPRTHVGLLLRHDVGADPEQVTVMPIDAGARPSVELATVTVEPPTLTVRAPKSFAIRDSESSAGAYAFREAFASGLPPASAMPWVFVLDGSLSMARRLIDEAAVSDVALVAGIAQEWMRRNPKLAMTTGVLQAGQVPVNDGFAADAVARVVGAPAPASWLHLGPPLKLAAEALASGGVVVGVVDSVPGDLDDVADVLESSRLELRLVLRGRAAAWYADDAAPMRSLGDRVVVVLDELEGPEGRPGRDVELARALAGEPVAGAAPR